MTPDTNSTDSVRVEVTGNGFSVAETVDRVTAAQIVAFIDTKKPSPQ